MTRTGTRVSGTAFDEELFVRATVESSGRCPARADYIEICFATTEGRWKWCFPEPDPADALDEPITALAFTLDQYGAQAHPIVDGTIGPAILSASALPMVLAGTPVHIARRLVLLCR
ncbi:hypothetical protein [Nocardia vermiculata]|uniref:Uncharacterized protein n=1 Tax=Nocardia vermiculata TaxID=257274 RepID=A0A846Y5G6_9NOCA|nr:hypothetical protein [Nocardia vermiculata]NKY53084.1 hypothetical protein [Nocardia vermiculata]